MYWGFPRIPATSRQSPSDDTTPQPHVSLESVFSFRFSLPPSNWSICPGWLRRIFGYGFSYRLILRSIFACRNQNLDRAFVISGFRRRRSSWGRDRYSSSEVEPVSTQNLFWKNWRVDIAMGDIETSLGEDVGYEADTWFFLLPFVFLSKNLKVSKQDENMFLLLCHHR